MLYHSNHKNIKIMEEAKKTTGRGGRREGSGRKALGKKAVTLKLSEESVEILSNVKNKSEYVDQLIQKST